MITTVCMNPSFDKTATVDGLQAGHVNRLSDVRYDVGGKGVNVAIVLRRLQIDVKCVGCVGKDDEASFRALVEAENVAFRYLTLPGKVRTNLKILDRASGLTTEFNEPGLTMDAEDEERFLRLLRVESEGSDHVVISGRLPIGCQSDMYRKCMQALRGTRCVLDAAGEALLLGVTERPFLVKPNLPELEAALDTPLRTLRSIRDAALLLMKKGAQNVVVSMGKYGAMLVGDDGAYYAPALQVQARSTVGAGDAMIGGILAGLSKGGSLPEALHYGMAAGAASVMTDGTQLIQVADFEALLPRVVLQPV